MKFLSKLTIILLITIIAILVWKQTEETVIITVKSKERLFDNQSGPTRLIYTENEIFNNNSDLLFLKTGEDSDSLYSKFSIGETFTVNVAGFKFMGRNIISIVKDTNKIN